MGNIEYEPTPDVIPGDGKDTFTGKGFLSQILDRYAGVICSITGMDKWWKPSVMSISDISAQMGQKAQKDGKLQSNLYASAANDLGNPDDGVTKENIFACPPLDKMATVSRHRFGYFGAEAISYKTPMPISTFDQLWEILTVKVVGGVRVVQYATQIHADTHLNGMTFVRTRHVDNYDYTQWQAWKRLATAEPPTKYPLLFNAGISGGGSYYKDQFGVARLQFQCNTLQPGAFAPGVIIAALPVGYRPTEIMEVPTFLISTAGATIGTLYLLSTGDVRIAHGSNTATGMCVNTVSYIAAP